MSNSVLFDEVSSLLGDNPGLVLPYSSLKGIYLGSALQNIESLSNRSIPSTIVSGVKLSARFKDISVDADDLDVLLRPDPVRDQLVASIEPGFTVTIELHPDDDPSIVISIVTIDVVSIVSDIVVSAPNVVFDDPDFDMAVNIQEGAEADRLAGIELAAITENDLMRIEGAFIHTIASKVISSSFSVAMGSINLEEYFPALSLDGSWEHDVVEVAGRSNLVIIPANVTMDGSRARVCPEGGVPRDIYDVDVPDSTAAGSGSYRVGVPTSPIQHNVNFEEVRNVNEGTLFLALYAPKPIFDKSFGAIKPSVAIRKRSNRTIGWKLSANAFLERLTLTLVPQRFGLELATEIGLDGSAEINVDVPCVGRKRIASMTFESDGPWELKFFAGLGFGSGDEVVLKTKLERVKTTDIDVEVSAFSRWLSWTGGKGVIMGLILDKIIGHYIGNEMKRKLRKEIYKAVQAGTFTIIDFQFLEELALPNWAVNQTISMDGNDKALFIGLENNWG